MDISYVHPHNPRQQQLHQGFFLLFFLFNFLQEQIYFAVSSSKHFGNGDLFFNRWIWYPKATEIPIADLLPVSNPINSYV